MLRVMIKGRELTKYRELEKILKEDGWCQVKQKVSQLRESEIMVYPAVLYPFSDGSGGYVVEFPDLPGCVTEGKDLEEAILMGTDAASGWILDELEEGNSIPEASAYKDVECREGGMVSMFMLDIEAYAEKYEEKRMSQ